MGEGAAEVARGHLVDAVEGEVGNGIGHGKVLNRGGCGMGVVGAAQLALVAADGLTVSDPGDPVGEPLVVAS